MKIQDESASNVDNGGWIARFALSGCKPVQPPLDLIKTQRETLDKAKAFEGQLQQQTQDRLKAAEDAQR